MIRSQTRDRGGSFAFISLTADHTPARSAARSLRDDFASGICLRIKRRRRHHENFRRHFCRRAFKRNGARPNRKPKLPPLRCNRSRKQPFSDTKEALAALEAGDFQLASTHLRNANANANRLSLQSLTQKLAISTLHLFSRKIRVFPLRSSSTIQFENFIQEQRRR